MLLQLCAFLLLIDMAAPPQLKTGKTINMSITREALLASRRFYLHLAISNIARAKIGDWPFFRMACNVDESKETESLFELCCGLEKGRLFGSCLVSPGREV